MAPNRREFFEKLPWRFQGSLGWYNMICYFTLLIISPLGVTTPWYNWLEPHIISGGK